MIRKTISMPDAMGKYIDQRVKVGQYGNDSEYIRDLIRKEREGLEAIKAVQAAIDEGMEGEGVEMTPSQVRQADRRSAAKKRRAG
ncbi:MAG: type II toxin-antitoxin system ParD family antitoxin [Hyphomonadaceae bacterium]|nr:type II toxin-antitoxin system ParD family antitoxin [Hyphomonadaceae bacterium]